MKIGNLNIRIEKIQKNEEYKLNNRHKKKIKKNGLFLAFFCSYLWCVQIGTILKNEFFNINIETLKSPDEIYEYISQNDNLNQDEINTIKELDDFINDYYYYMDKNLVKENLRNFDIKYEIKKDKSIYGRWLPITKELIIYDAPSSKTLKDNKETVDHELLHLLSTKIKVVSRYSICLYEGITSLINYEYSNYEYTNVYYKQVLISQLLCELLGKECVVESYLQSDMDILKNELLKIDHDSNRVSNFLDSFDDYQKIYSKLVNYTEINLDDNTYNEFSIIKEKELDLLKQISDEFKYYYETKNKKTIDKNSTYYLYAELLEKNNNIVIEKEDSKMVYYNDSFVKSRVLKKN